MAHLNYEEGKKRFLFVIILLGVITIGEVLIALMGKGYIIEGMHLPRRRILGREKATNFGKGQNRNRLQ